MEPSRLLFDPNLQPLHLDKHRVKGILTNTGHSVVFTVDNETRHPVNISGGSLSYRYQFHEIHLHYGLYDESGSEHTVDGYAFPAEVSQYIFFLLLIFRNEIALAPQKSSFSSFQMQIFGFNSQLYNNFSEALHRAQGIVAVSLLLQVSDLFFNEEISLNDTTLYFNLF